MGGYTVVGFVKGWTKSIFGILLALAVGWMLGSPFLGILTFAVLFFIPMDDEETEEQFNAIGFAIVMFFLLLWAFGSVPAISAYFPAEGLGINLGPNVQIGGWHYFALGLLILGALLKGVILSPKVRGGKSIKIGTSDEAMFNLFVIIGLIAVFILNIFLFKPWDWSFSAIIFVAIWFITLFSGFFGGVETKQTIGVIMIILSFVLYTFGIGSNVVGEAAFGQWWPQVKDFGKQTLVPIKDAFTNMFKSFKDAVNLLLCPTCAVRDIVQGIYVNPTGKGNVGSYGLEFDELTVPEGKITLGRPFSITTSLKNQGAKDATDINLALSVSGANGQEIGVSELKPGLLDKYEKLPVEDAKQKVVVGTLSCDSIKDRELVKNYVAPVKVVADYNYSMETSLSVQFIKVAERERLLKDKKLERARGRGEMTTSPLAVSVSLDIDQPIEEKTRFYVGVEAKTQEKDGEAKNVVVRINLPKEFGTPDLTPGPNNTIAYGKDVVIDSSGTLVWNVGSLGEDEGKKMFLDFKGFEINTPTKTFVLAGSASFRFEKWRELSTKFEFGGFCCPGIEEDKACTAGNRCEPLRDQGKNLGRCVPSASTVDKKLFGKDKFCETKISGGYGLCEHGEGGCSFVSECNRFDATNGNLTCKTLSGLGIGVCCYDLESDQQCADAFQKKI